MRKNIIQKAVEQAGSPITIGNACRVTYQAVRKWERRGHLPRTEWSGETKYSEIIANLPGVTITADEFLAARPPARS